MTPGIKLYELKERAQRMVRHREEVLQKHRARYNDVLQIGRARPLSEFLLGDGTKEALSAVWEIAYLRDLIEEIDRGVYCDIRGFKERQRNEILCLASSSCLQGGDIWKGIRLDSQRLAAGELLRWLESLTTGDSHATPEKRTAAGNRQPQDPGTGAPDDVAGQASAGKP